MLAAFVLFCSLVAGAAPALPADGSVLPVTPLERLRDFNLRALIYRVSIHTGPRRLTRDVSIIHRRQVEAGRAVWLGEPWPEDRPPAPPLADLDRAVARVRALFPALGSADVNCERRAPSDRTQARGEPDKRSGLGSSYGELSTKPES